MSSVPLWCLVYVIHDTTSTPYPKDPRTSSPILGRPLFSTTPIFSVFSFPTNYPETSTPPLWFPIGLLQWFGLNGVTKDQLKFCIRRFSVHQFLIHWFEDVRRNVYCRDYIFSGTITNEFSKKFSNPSREQVKFDRVWWLGGWPGRTHRLPAGKP